MGPGVESEVLDRYHEILGFSILSGLGVNSKIVSHSTMIIGYIGDGSSKPLSFSPLLIMYCHLHAYALKELIIEIVLDENSWLIHD